MLSQAAAISWKENQQLSQFPCFSHVFPLLPNMHLSFQAIVSQLARTTVRSAGLKGRMVEKEKARALQNAAADSG
jgi:hypothetical protein